MTHVITNTQPNTTAYNATVTRTVMNEFVIDGAKARFGDKYDNCRKFARQLTYWSEDAQNERFSSMIADGHTFGEIYDLYEEAEKFLGRAFIQAVEPDALSHNEFMSACSAVTCEATISPKCPACGAHTLESCKDFLINEPNPKSLEVVCECSNCGLSPTMDIDIVKPTDKNEQLIRSYIRSLLVFEEYRPNCGPIIDKRILERVSAQAYKAMVHLPNGLTFDYDKVVKEEMTNFEA